MLGLDPSLGSAGKSGASERQGGGSGFWGAISSWGKRLIGGAGEATDGAARSLRKKPKKKKKSNSKAASDLKTKLKKDPAGQTGRKSGGFFGMFRRNSWKKSRTESSTISAASPSSVDIDMIDEDCSSSEDEESTSPSNIAANSASAGWATPQLVPGALLTAFLSGSGRRVHELLQPSPPRPLLSHLAHCFLTCLTPSHLHLSPDYGDFELNMGGRSVCGFESLESFARSAPADRSLTSCDGRGVSGAACVFGLCFSHLLTVLDDSELYDAQTPLPCSAIVRLVGVRVLLFACTGAGYKRVCRSEPKVEEKGKSHLLDSSPLTALSSHRTPFVVCLRAALTGVLVSFNRSSRRALAYPSDPNDMRRSGWCLSSALSSALEIISLGFCCRAQPPQSKRRKVTMRAVHRVGLTLSACAAIRLFVRTPSSGHALVHPVQGPALLFQHIISQQRDRDQDGDESGSARVRRSQISRIPCANPLVKICASESMSSLSIP